MKVLKHGVLNKTNLDYALRFRCRVCRCEFEATVKEYKIYENHEPFGFDFAYTKCPECENECRTRIDYSKVWRIDLLKGD